MKLAKLSSAELSKKNIEKVEGTSCPSRDNSTPEIIKLNRQVESIFKSKIPPQVPVSCISCHTDGEDYDAPVIDFTKKGIAEYEKKNPDFRKHLIERISPNANKPMPP